MSFFFVPVSTARIGETVTLDGQHAHRLLNVRRFKIGETIAVQDESEQRFIANITAAGPRSISLKIESLAVKPAQPKRDITLIAAYVSESALDFILQKSTELGANHLVIFQAEFSPHAPKEDRLGHKIERWNSILTHSCEQSGRDKKPSFVFTKSLGEALATLSESCTIVACEEGSTDPFPKNNRLAICIGPEGGWSKNELALLQKHHSVLVSIAPYTLRSETAAIAAVTLALN